MKLIKIALTKGRLEKSIIKMLEEVGLDCSELKDKGRKLIFHDNINSVDFVLAKANDVLTYVEHGASDIGIVGKDTLMEADKNFYEVVDLKMGNCKFSIAALPDFKLEDGYNIKKIATKYPRVAKDYFRQQGMDVEIIRIEGSVELAPILGLADAIVDLVETGETLRENGLVIVKDICNISARLIINRASMKMKKDEITELIGKIQKYVEE
ncbi:MAG TPA: ATP phosphoribosyltransferase [Clostridiaceae bacterium]